MNILYFVLNWIFFLAGFNEIMNIQNGSARATDSWPSGQAIENRNQISRAGKNQEGILLCRAIIAMASTLQKNLDDNNYTFNDLRKLHIDQN